jgi:glycosyltransferase involved in cell wall biosynthesis
VASPTKFAEYLACGLPVITTEYVGDFSLYVKEHNLGYVIDLNKAKFDSALGQFIEDVSLEREDFTNRCVSFVRDYLEWSVYKDKLQQILESFETIQ